MSLSLTKSVTAHSSIPWGLIYMLMNAVLASIASLLAKHLHGFSGFELVFWRSVFMFLVLTVILLARGENPLGEPGTRSHLLARSIANFILSSSFYFAVQVLHLSDAVVITYTSPALTGIAATLCFGEPWGFLDTFGSFLSMTGVVLVSKPAFIVVSEEPPPLHGTGAALVAACSASMLALLLRMRRDISPLVSVNYIAFTGVVLGFICGYARGETFAPTDGLELTKLAALGAFAGAAMIFMICSLAVETAGKASAVNYLQVVFAYVWQALIFNHFGDTLSMTGAALISSWGALSFLKELSGSRDDEAHKGFFDGSWLALKQEEMGDLQAEKNAAEGWSGDDGGTLPA